MKLAIKAVKERIEKGELHNVTAVLTDGKSFSLPDESADVIYAPRHVSHGQGSQYILWRTESVKQS